MLYLFAILIILFFTFIRRWHLKAAPEHSQTSIPVKLPCWLPFLHLRSLLTVSGRSSISWCALPKVIHLTQGLPRVCPWPRTPPQPTPGTSVPAPAMPWDSLQLYKLIPQPQPIFVSTEVADDLGWRCMAPPGERPLYLSPRGSLPRAVFLQLDRVQLQAYGIEQRGRIPSQALEDYFPAAAPRGLLFLQQPDFVGPVSSPPRWFPAELLFKQLFPIMC